MLATNHDPGALTRPTPTLRDVARLIGDLRGTKAPVRLHVDGELEAVPGQVGLAGYRIIQEGLTNTLKHANGAAVAVHIRVHDHAVEMTILNTSAGTTATRNHDGNGHGIVGMQERAHILGGTLAAGPDPHTGGWRVAASLPW